MATITKIDYQTIIKQLMSSLDTVPERIQKSVADLQDIFDDAYTMVLGSVAFLADRTKRTGEDTTEAMRRVRQNKGLKEAAVRVVESTRERTTRFIYMAEAKMYRDSMRQIAQIWNSQTPDGLKFVAKIDESEIKNLKNIVIEGLTVEEWMDRYFSELSSKLKARITKYVSGETGIQTGKRLFLKNVRGMLDKTYNQVLQIAIQAVSLANREAFEQENTLFDDDSNWKFA